MSDVIMAVNLSLIWFRNILKTKTSSKNLLSRPHLNKTAILNPTIPFWKSDRRSGAVCQRFEFYDLKDVKNTMNQFREFYNFERIHGGIGFQSPAEFLFQKGIDMKNSPINLIIIP